jgi:hypothetical protein
MELLFRPRRLRRREPLRRMLRETHLRPEDLIYPMFAAPGSRVRQEVPSMPGVARLSPDLLVDEAKAALDLGVPAVLLFGIPEKKDEKLRAYRKLGPRKRFRLSSGFDVFARTAGISDADAIKVVDLFTLQGSLPEPVRVAKLLARAGSLL